MALWLVGLLVLAAANQVAAGVLRGSPWELRQFLYLVPGWAGLLLPFVGFAGGLAGRSLSASSVLKRGVLLAVISYGLMAYTAPIIRYRLQLSADPSRSARYPFGPETPAGLLAHRSAVQANPPEVFSFQTDRPLERPPNWLTYLICSVIVLAGFTILSVLLGHRVGSLTTGLSPPDRRNARWALGLVSGGLFFVAEAGGGEWVRASPLNSGVLGAGFALVVPLAGLALLELVFRARRRELRP